MAGGVAEYQAMWSRKNGRFSFQDARCKILGLLFIAIQVAQLTMNDQEAFAVALEEARLGYREGGVPVSTPE